MSIQHSLLPYQGLLRFLQGLMLALFILEEGFFYHAWPEVYVGRWVSGDPTLNQFPADATHIRFVTGDLESRWR